MPLDFVKVRVKDTDKTKFLNMYVVKYDRDPLLDRKWINQLKKLASVKNSLIKIRK